MFLEILGVKIGLASAQDFSKYTQVLMVQRKPIFHLSRLGASQVVLWALD
jgi:hypothetical protein